MAYVPGFRYDLFVSYASEDNADGWVEKLQAQLTAELTRLLGRPFSDKTVYLDTLRLQVGQAYPEELDKAARDSAMLVALLSPAYSTSDWCIRERRVFQEHLAPGATLAECLAAVRVRPTGSLPEVLQHAQRHDFVMAGFQEPWPIGSPKWLESVNRLAVEIRDALQKLRNRSGAVFIGSTLNSHMHLRASLVDFLAEQHFRATPHPVALLDDPVATQKALSEAACAVHYVGGASDTALDAVEVSLAHCSGATILFQPFAATLTAGEELFLSGIAPDRYPHRISANETELKKFLEELLTRTRNAAATRPASLGLVCEPADFPWAENFRAEGLSVDYPRFLQEKLTNTDRIRLLRQLVRESHGLLFYQGRSEEIQLERIQRLAAEEKSRAVRRWYLDHPDLDAKRHHRPGDPAYPEGLESFLDEVRRRAGGSS